MSEFDPSDPTTDQVSFDTPRALGESRGRRAGKAIGWIAVGAVGASVLTGVAVASTRTGDNTVAPAGAVGVAATTPAPGEGPMGSGRMGGRPMGGPGMHGMGGRLLGPDGAVLHGELVVKGKDGVVKTLLTQNGKVTEASSTSLTVKSSDGFTATWTLNPATKVHTFASRGAKAKTTDIKVGDDVVVTGTKATATSGTADRVGVQPTAAELKKLKKNAPKGWGDMRGNRPGRPAPAATASASSTGA